MRFAERMGFEDSSIIQLNSISERLRTRLFNYYKMYTLSFDVFYNPEYAQIYQYMADHLGLFDAGKHNADNLETVFIDARKQFQWYVPYEIIELLLEGETIYGKEERYIGDKLYSKADVLNILAQSFNQILEEEHSGYRICDNKFAKITDEVEIAAIEEAAKNTFEAVKSAIKKAVRLFSDREKPDYENCIKEAISAVESMCCIITGEFGAQATLGKMLGELEAHGVVIHKAMQEGFKKLYGYTSDEGGIRHGSIDFRGATEEDARYMLISCSAFVNYLADKYRRIQ